MENGHVRKPTPATNPKRILRPRSMRSGAHMYKSYSAKIPVARIAKIPPHRLQPNVKFVLVNPYMVVASVAAAPRPPTQLYVHQAMNKPGIKLAHKRDIKNKISEDLKHWIQRLGIEDHGQMVRCIQSMAEKMILDSCTSELTTNWIGGSRSVKFVSTSIWAMMTLLKFLPDLITKIPNLKAKFSLQTRSIGSNGLVCMFEFSNEKDKFRSELLFQEYQNKFNSPFTRLWERAQKR